MRGLLKVLRPKTYPNWVAAVEAAGAFDGPLNRFRAARSAHARKAGWEPDLTLTPLPMLLGLFPGNVAVTDFGGGFGDFGRALARYRPGLTCSVVEAPGVLELAQPGDGVTFQAEIPEKCDIFYSNCVLPYLADPYGMLDRGFASAWYAVALDRNHAYADRETFTVQKSRLFDNGGGPVPEGFRDAPVTVPARTIIEARIHQIAAQHGFRLAYRAADAASLVFIKA